MIISLLVLNLVLLVIAVLLGVRLIEFNRTRKTLQGLMDHAHTGYYKYRHKDGVVLAANKSFMEIIELDIKKDKAIGRSLSELIIYVDDEENMREKVKRDRLLRNFEYHFKTLQGKDKWVLYNSFMVRDPRTGEEVIEAMIKDITMERKSYENVRRAEERYRKLFKNSGDMVVIYKFETGIIEEINPVTAILTGFSEVELVGRPFESLFHPSSRKNLEEVHKDLAFRGASRLEGLIVCKNGSYKETSLTLSMFEFEEEKIVMAIVKDVSALVRERKEQMRRKEELEKFWEASVEREERIKDIRTELQVSKQQIKLLKEKNEFGKQPEEE
ncbi:MAG: PAS domain S-box protein [Candidatus Omnitrophota bacterium]